MEGNLVGIIICSRVFIEIFNKKENNKEEKIKMKEV
jgi:hypothetical protein